MKDYKEWFEDKYGFVYPAPAGETMDDVYETIASSMANYFEEFIESIKPAAIKFTVKVGDVEADMVKDNNIHLCDSCSKKELTCDSKGLIYGDGKGKDNICCCSSYEPLLKNWNDSCPTVTTTKEEIKLPQSSHLVLLTTVDDVEYTVEPEKVVHKFYNGKVTVYGCSLPLDINLKMVSLYDVKLNEITGRVKYDEYPFFMSKDRKHSFVFITRKK